MQIHNLELERCFVLLFLFFFLLQRYSANIFSMSPVFLPVFNLSTFIQFPSNQHALSAYKGLFTTVLYFILLLFRNRWDIIFVINYTYLNKFCVSVKPSYNHASINWRKEKSVFLMSFWNPSFWPLLTHRSIGNHFSAFCHYRCTYLVLFFV